MNGKGLLVYTAFTMLVGGALAQTFIDKPTEYKVIHVKGDTETITKVIRPPAEVVMVVPDACLAVAKSAAIQAKASERIAISQSRVVNIYAESRLAISLGEFTAINALDTELRQIRGRTADAMEAIGNETDFPSDLRECKQAAK